jgi:DNA-binding PadR family transcriptional regulator
MAGNEGRSTRPVAGTHFYVLLALSDEPRYGVGIAEEVERQTGGAIHLGPGTLYTAVKSMLEEGLIEEWAPADDAGGDPRRRYYRITRKGREVLTAEAARLDSLLEAVRLKHVLP